MQTLAFAMEETEFLPAYLGVSSGLHCNFASISAPEELTYIRDCSFPLKHRKGIQYIPRDVKNDGDAFIEKYEKGVTLGYYHETYDLLDEKTAKLTGPSSISSDAFIGKSSLVMNFLYENNFSYQAPGVTVIEGGNIFFIIAGNTTKAVIGDHSLLLTYLVAVRNKFYDLDAYAEQNAVPREKNKASYCVAKARALVDECPQLTDAIAFALNLRNESLFDLDTIEQEAQKDAKILQWCRQQIAKEIHLPLEDIIFIPQRSYHIDLDLLVTVDQRILFRAPLAGERALWQKTQDILLSELGQKAVITEEHNFTEGLLFCGLAVAALFDNSAIDISEKSDSHTDTSPQAVPQITSCFFLSQTESASADLIESFSRFLRENCGFTYVEGIIHPDYETCHMGVHCLSQEYFPNVGKREQVCSRCKKPGRLLRCQRPCLMPFCSLRCQKKAWRAGHKDVCPNRKIGQGTTCAPTRSL